MGSDGKEIEEVLRLKKRRLRELQKDLARLGYDAPPALRTEEEDLRNELEKERRILEPVMKGELSDEALAALRAYGLPASIASALQNFEARLYDWRREFLAFRDQQSRLRETEHSERETRQQETDKQREHVNIRLTRIEAYIMGVGALLVVIGLYIVLGPLWAQLATGR